MVLDIFALVVIAVSLWIVQPIPDLQSTGYRLPLSRACSCGGADLILETSLILTRYTDPYWTWS